MEKVYRSAIDRWLLIVLCLAPATITSGIWVEYEATGRLSISGCMGLLVILGLYRSLIVPMRYTLTEESLVIKFGVLTRTILYGDIDGAECSGELWSSPALSLKRIKISYNEGSFVLISPKDRTMFLAELNVRLARCKH